MPTTVSTSVAASLCQTEVGGNLLQGVVTSVHDGDTLTLTVANTTYKIRLDSMDAPELEQPFGSLSQAALSSVVLGKTVRVAYAKTDLYGRIVGTVFTDSCQYVNLGQVQSGMAWFYRAYQCELSANVRSQFMQAQNAASSAHMGLWSQTNPTAPWVFRNGFDPAVPTCTSDAATVATVTSSTRAVVCAQVWVKPYVRTDGIQVSGYWRNSAGCT